MNDQIKLCKNCKHCVRDRSWWWNCLFLPLAPFFAWQASNLQWKYSQCRRTAKSDYDDGHRYTGERYKENYEMRYCAAERNKPFGDIDRCGPDAKYFEARQ